MFKLYRFKKSLLGIDVVFSPFWWFRCCTVTSYLTFFFLKKNKNNWLTHLPQCGNLNCWFPSPRGKKLKFSIFTLGRKLSHKAMNKLIKISNYKMVLNHKMPETMTRYHRFLIITVIMLSLWPWTITVTLNCHMTLTF